MQNDPRQQHPAPQGGKVPAHPSVHRSRLAPPSRVHDPIGARPGSERSFRHHLANAGWFLCGLGFGFTALTFALGAVPKSSEITDDSSLHENLSEIRVKKVRQIDFDADIARLSQIEGRYAQGVRRLKPSPRPQVAAQAQNPQRH